MSQFVLLLRDDRQAVSGLSPQEMQELVQRYGAWRQSLQAKGVGGQKLTDGDGRVLRKQNGKPVISDGPFTEAKEIMGGFFIIEAADFNEAVELAKTCPHMDFGSIEIRQVDVIRQAARS